MVMGGDSCFKGCEFESQHHILDGHIFHIPMCVKFVMCVRKEEIKWKKEAEDGPLKN